LVLKSKQYLEEAKENLVGKLCDIMDDKIYGDVSLRIIYQLILETQSASGVIIDNVPLSKILQMENREYREKNLQIAVVFHENAYFNVDLNDKTKEDINARVESDEIKTFMILAFALKARHCAEFENKFEDFILSFKRNYGNYYKCAMNPHVRLLFKIAEQKEMNRTMEFILNKCQFVKEITSTMEFFYELQDLKQYRIFPFKSDKLNELVRLKFSLFCFRS
jgi:mRNA-degrading endonuclease YafQ of YafQ-DinJ toxin-antitoxin module